MKNELTELKLTDSERASIPLGYGVIFVKDIVPREVEDKVRFYSEKYRHSALSPTPAEKPISKIIMQGE